MAREPQSTENPGRGECRDQIRRVPSRVCLTRRRFLTLGLVGAPGLALADAGWVEPRWVRVRQFRLGEGKPRLRLVHFTDLHHKGDRGFLQSVVAGINALAPTIVCFTGDLVEEREHMAETVELLGGIQAPLYAIPGNHDYWCKAPFEGIDQCCARSGGKWLLDQQVTTPDGRWTISGMASLSSRIARPRPNPATGNLLLVHYPACVKKLDGARFDLILAGHSHGGQVRLPWMGPVVVPFGVDHYDLGLFQTGAGPLYVNPGIGWFFVPLRFNCRPELTVFELG